LTENSRSRAAALLPLAIGILLGFIGGYFAGGGGRPGGSSESAAASASGGDRIAEIRRSLDREDWGHAIGAYEKALRKAPNDPNVLSDLGAAYRNRGEFKRAVALFTKARAADPDHWQSLLNLVLVYAFDLRDDASAKRAFEELKRRYPEIPNLDRLQQQIDALKTKV